MTRGLRAALAATLPDRITRTQSAALHVLYGELGRVVPELAHLTFGEAGDLIIGLRAELLNADGEAKQ